MATGTYSSQTRNIKDSEGEGVAFGEGRADCVAGAAVEAAAEEVMVNFFMSLLVGNIVFLSKIVSIPYDLVFYCYTL